MRENFLNALVGGIEKFLRLSFQRLALLSHEICYLNVELSGTGVIKTLILLQG